MAGIVSPLKFYYNIRLTKSLVRHALRLGCTCRCSSSSPESHLVNNPNIKDYLKFLESRYDAIKTTELPELREISPIIQILLKKQSLENSLESLQTLAKENDQELRKLINEEKLTYLSQMNKLNDDILTSLMPEEDQQRDVIFQITSGVGGVEATLFAGELYTMYTNYAKFKGWSWEPELVSPSESGGLKQCSVLVSGTSVFQYLREEAGVHRVQRVPKTDKSGRMHTSTAAIAVLPQLSDIDVYIPSKDVIEEVKNSSGAGGQHVNKTKSCVRLTHIPTGLVVEAQEERCQMRNRKIAMRKLRDRLYEIENSKQTESTSKLRKLQMGLSQRNEKIRTFNYPQSRITDHRLGQSSFNLPSFLEGGKDLDNFILKLMENSKKGMVLDYVSQKLKENKVARSSS